MATTDQDESSIPELQAALGPLLLTRASPRYTSQAPGSYVLPKWTGVFKLFDFPRELRDRIYHYVVYVSGGVCYTTKTNAHLQNRSSSDVVNLLLVSKQVYHEALKEFGRSNTVALSSRYNAREGYRKPLTGLLRLFPDPAADALTKVRYVYHDTTPRPIGTWSGAPSHASIANGDDGTGHFHMDQRPGGTFLEILRDAHVISQRFPKLKVFDAAWYAGPGFHEYLILECVVHKIATFRKNYGSREEAVKMWLGLMRRWLQKGNVVPLGCVWLNVQGFGADGFEWKIDEVANEAYQIVVKESEDQEDIEASGKIWLEEMEEASRRKKKGKCGRKATHNQ